MAAPHIMKLKHESWWCTTILFFTSAWAGSPCKAFVVLIYIMLVFNDQKIRLMSWLAMMKGLAINACEKFLVWNRQLKRLIIYFTRKIRLGRLVDGWFSVLLTSKAAGGVAWSSGQKILLKQAKKIASNGLFRFFFPICPGRWNGVHVRAVHLRLLT